MHFVDNVSLFRLEEEEGEEEEKRCKTEFTAKLLLLSLGIMSLAGWNACTHAVVQWQFNGNKMYALGT